MKFVRTSMLAAAGLALIGCIPSVNPFYRSEDISFDRGLLGEWVDGDEHWVFERLENEDRYILGYDNGDENGSMFATLFTLGEHRFLDVIAAEMEFADDEWEIVQASVFPGHLLFHVEATDPTIRLALMDYDWLEEYIDDNPKALAHNRVGEERILLTGKTRELQRFVLRHIDDGELFDDPFELSRLGE